jgi:hypothetical protein
MGGRGEGNSYNRPWHQQFGGAKFLRWSNTEMYLYILWIIKTYKIEIGLHFYYNNIRNELSTYVKPQQNEITSIVNKGYNAIK